MALRVVITVTSRHATVKREIDGGKPVLLFLYTAGRLAFPSPAVTGAYKGAVPVCFWSLARRQALACHPFGWHPTPGPDWVHSRSEEGLG